MKNRQQAGATTMRDWRLLLITLLACLPLMEIAVRIADPPLLHVGETVLLLSAVPQRDGHGGIRFEPNIAVREVVVAGDTIEYDVRFRTNNRGRVDHRDYTDRNQSERVYAVVGDSYAMGVEGGEPWLPKLRDDTGLELYNFGMGAVGVAEFARILNREAADLWFSDIVVIAISDDFTRPLFDLEVSGQDVWFCIEGQSNEQCRARPAIVHLIDADIDQSGLIERARAARASSAVSNSDDSAVLRLLKYSKLLVFLKRLTKPTVHSGSLHTELGEQNLQALAGMRSAFPEKRLWFVHVPDKFETVRQRYDVDLGETVKSYGFDYLPALERCEFTPDLYYTNDNHPNREGYQRLSQCVRKLLEFPLRTAAAEVPATSVE